MLSPRPPRPNRHGAMSVDFRRCKEAAGRLLPPGHPVREALLREDDFVPSQAAAVKIETYIRLLTG